MKRRHGPVVKGERLGEDKRVSEELTDIGGVSSQGGGELVGHGCREPGVGRWGRTRRGRGWWWKRGEGVKCRDWASEGSL